MGDEIKEQGLEKEKTGLQCLPKTEYLKIVGRGRTIYIFYYPKCYVTSLIWLSYAVQLEILIEGFIEKWLIYAYYRAKPCLHDDIP